MSFQDYRFHFWAADDGRVFDSERALITDTNHPPFKTVVEKGWMPTVWPRDDDGKHTNAMMQLVMSTWFIDVNLFYYTARKRQQFEERGFTTKKGIAVKGDDRTLTLALTLRIAAQNGTPVQWHASDGKVYALDEAGMLGVSDAIAARIADSYQRSADVLAKVDSGEITERRQVDEAFA